MQDKFYFTLYETLSMDVDELHGVLDEGAWNSDPNRLEDGTLYRVTIERVGRVRTTKEVEFDSAQSEESN